MIKKLSLLAVVALSAIAFADKNLGSHVKVRAESWTIANNLATNAALLTATSGIDYNSGGAVAGIVCAESGQTIAGGSLRAYVYMPISETAVGTVPVTYLWLPYPALDFSPSTGHRCAATGDKQSLTGIGRIAWVEDSVTVSGGTTVTVAYTRRLGQPSVNK